MNDIRYLFAYCQAGFWGTFFARTAGALRKQWYDADGSPAEGEENVALDNRDSFDDCAGSL
jgi:hypothetical protein